MVTSQRKVIVVLIVLVLAVAGLMAIEFTRVRDILYTQITESAARGLRDRLLIFLSPPIDNMQVVKGWIGAAEANQGPEKTLATMLHPVLSGQKAVSAVMLSDTRGLVCLLAQEGAGFTGVVRSTGSPAEFRWLRFGPHMEPLEPAEGTAKQRNNAASEAAAGNTLISSLEAVLRASREGAVPGRAEWSGVHGVPGLTNPCVSASIFIGDNAPDGLMLTFSFSLDDIRDVCAKDLPTGNEKVLLFSHGGGILDFDTQRFADGTGEPALAHGPAVTGAEVNSILIAARSAWTQAGRQVNHAFRFPAQDSLWWASLEPLLGDDGKVVVGAAIPQADLWAEFLSGTNALVLMGTGVAVVLILLVLLLLYYRRSLGAAEPAFFPTEEAVAALIGQGEGDQLEFKSTLRLNLNSGKPGKEIELASLKTLAAFLNSQGGILVVGVDDAGQVVGLDADGFENDDHLLRHFGSLVNQHLGIECARFLRFAIRPSPGGKVFIVRCVTSKEPVFLDNGKDEEFYVRVGPSSRKLTLRQFYARVTQGKGGR